MVKIESEELHNFLANYYDTALSKNEINAKRNLSKVILEFKKEIERLENG